MTPPTPESVADNGRTEPVVIRDKRRIDPTTGEVRPPADHPTEEHTMNDAHQGQPSAAPDAPEPTTGKHAAPDPEGVKPADETVPAATSEEAASLLADLQRLQAEYQNYRKRVERDRELARTMGMFSSVEALLPVLDDLYFAREHGDLVDGPMASIAEKLDTALAKLGLERYGNVGEAFDPTIHEALVSQPGDDVDVATVSMVMQPGYRMQDKVLRPARVGVKNPQ